MAWPNIFQRGTLFSRFSHHHVVVFLLTFFRYVRCSSCALVFFGFVWLRELVIGTASVQCSDWHGLKKQASYCFCCAFWYLFSRTILPMYGNVQRHFWVSHRGKGCLLQWVETRDAAVDTTVHGRASHKREFGGPKMSVVPWLRNPGFIQFVSC